MGRAADSSQDPVSGRRWRAGGRWQDMPLLVRIFLTNAAVLTAAVLVLALSPATVSSPVLLWEAVVLVAGVTAVLIVNLAILRRAFESLGRLTELMRSVEPLRPGVRIPVYGHDREVKTLTAAFNEMLARLEGERRESVGRTLAAQEGERRRVAQELHDEVGQSLTAVVLQLERVGRSVRDPASSGELEEARETARASLLDVRRIARALRPDVLEDLGLRSALMGLTERVSERGGVHVERRIERDLQLDPERELVVYRVAQEALTNVLRHANASTAELALCRRGDMLTLSVIDDGQGIDGATPGTGVQGMRERALLVEGQLSIGPRRDGGTEVRLDLPLERA
jgi:two-component system sensor histidine kinase UhpB